MNNKERPSNTVKMYWQEVPSEGDQIKNILPTGMYCEPGNIVNSTCIDVNAKPRLQKATLRRENKNAVAPHLCKQTNPKGKISSKNNDGQVQGSTGCKTDNASNYNQPTHACSLAELRKEDKQRVADLVREMAKFSEEKEMAVKELNALKATFSEKLNMVEDEKQKMIKERDSLKEKLLRYELVLSEIKDSRQSVNQNGVDTILNNHLSLQDLSEVAQDFEKKGVNRNTSPEECPGNSKGTKHNVFVHNSTENDLKCQGEKKCLPRENLEDVDKVTDLFFKQQDKFNQQQKILQTQIEQLQKLQEGILLQQEQHLKEILVDTKKESHSSQANQVPCRNLQQQQDNLQEMLFSNEPSKLEHSQKLQNYIAKQSKFNKTDDAILPEACKENFKKVDNPSPILFEDTITKEMNKDNTLISVHCLNPTTTSSSIETAVQTEDVGMQDYHLIKSKDVCLQRDGGRVQHTTAKADICVGTDDDLEGMDVDQCPSKYGAKALELCKSHVNKLGEALINISSEKVILRSNVINQKADSKVTKTKKHSPVKKVPLIVNSQLDDDSDEDCDIARSENNSLSSALQTQYFRPASMLELIDGIQPPSTSTSISSSFKKVSPINNQRSHRTPLSPTNGHVKAKVKGAQATKLQKVYGAIKNKQSSKKQNAKDKSLEDIEEQKMIADVFFVR